MLSTNLYPSPAIPRQRLGWGLIRKIHESRLGGHMGISKTIAKVKQNYDFPGIKQATEAVLAECNLCGRKQARTTQAIRAVATIASRRTTIEFGNDGLYHQTTGIQRLSYGSGIRQHPHVGGQTHQIELLPPLQRDIVSRTTRRRNLSQHHLHGWPEEWITDRDTKFASKFWQALITKLGIKSKLSTAYHL
jgi:hypothetical protein